MADRPRGAEGTPLPFPVGTALHAIVEQLRRAGVVSMAEARAAMEARVALDQFVETRRLLPSEKARGLLVHVLGGRAYMEAWRNGGWIAIRSRRFPRFEYWLNLFTPNGFRVCRLGEGPFGMIAANICIGPVVRTPNGDVLPTEDAALAMYLLAAYQEDRLLVVGNPDRNWY